MKGSRLHAVAAIAAALALFSGTKSSIAQEAQGAPGEGRPPPSPATSPPPVVVTPPPRDVVVIQQKVPNAGLITSGVLMLGIPYAGSVIVAASSERPSDKNLYIPVAGPWMDLANRGECPSGRCENETSSRVLLVANGILQGVGALQILGGFIFPSTRTIARTARVHVTPTVGLSSVGLSASGAF